MSPPANSTEGARQNKFFISETAAEHLDAALDGKAAVLPWCDLRLNAELYNATPSDRAGNAMLQVAFLVTRDDGTILVVNRSKDNHSLTVDNSVLISTKPDPDKMPTSDAQVLNLFTKKISSQTFLGIATDIRFLGVVKNLRHIKDSDMPASYYFYVFEIRCKAGEASSLQAIQAGNLSRFAGRNTDDRLLNWHPLDDKLTEILPKTNYADFAALHLLGEHRDINLYDSLQTPASWVHAGQACLYADIANKFFIAHHSADYDHFVNPLIKAMERNGKKVWFYEKDGEQSELWQHGNGNVLRYTRGAIFIESPNSLSNPYFQQEAAIAVRMLKRYPDSFKIIRLCAAKAEETVWDSFMQSISDLLKQDQNDGHFQASDAKLYADITCEPPVWLTHPDTLEAIIQKI